MNLFSIKCAAGIFGMSVAGAFSGGAAGVSIAMNIGVADAKTFGIIILVTGIVGVLAGLGMGLATFCCRESSRNQKAWMLVKPGVAQASWVLLAVGVSLPYLTFVTSTVPYLSQIPFIKLDSNIFLRAAGLIGTLLWGDGVALQLVLAYRILRA